MCPPLSRGAALTSLSALAKSQSFWNSPFSWPLRLLSPCHRSHETSRDDSIYSLVLSTASAGPAYLTKTDGDRCLFRSAVMMRHFGSES